MEQPKTPYYLKPCQKLLRYEFGLYLAPVYADSTHVSLDLWLNVKKSHVLCCQIGLLPQKILTEKERKRRKRGGRAVLSLSFFFSIPSLELLLKRAQELRFQHSSSMFAYHLSILSNYGLDTFNANVGIFMSYEWSTREFVAAFKKYPFLGCQSRIFRRRVVLIPFLSL